MLQRHKKQRLMHYHLQIYEHSLVFHSEQSPASPSSTPSVIFSCFHSRVQQLTGSITFSKVGSWLGRTAHKCVLESFAIDLAYSSQLQGGVHHSNCEEAMAQFPTCWGSQSSRSASLPAAWLRGCPLICQWTSLWFSESLNGDHCIAKCWHFAGCQTQQFQSVDAFWIVELPSLWSIMTFCFDIWN